MRCKKIMALACALAMAISCLPVWGGVAFAADNIVHNGTMNYEGYWTTHTAWDSENSKNVNTSVISYDSENQRYNVAPITDDESSSYYQKNGGIMDYAYDSSSGSNVNLFENGKSYTASATIHNSDTSGSKTYEFIMDGVTGITYENNTVTVAAGETGYIKDAVITISDSATTSYPKFVIEPISSDQGNTTFWLDDVSMIEDTATPTLDTKTLVDSSIYTSTDSKITIYDPDNAGGEISTVWENYGLQAEFTSSWNTDNGIKVDITDNVKGYSGQTFDLSIVAQNWSWGDSSWVNKVTAFFKVVDADGNVTKTTIASGPASYSDVVENVATITGSTTLTFNATDTVYLCFTHGAGTQQYKTVSLTATVPETEEDPYTFETSSSFDTVTTDETTTGTLTFETTVDKATEDAVAAADVASYGYVAINFDNLSDGSTYDGSKGAGITNIEVKADAQATPEGYDGDVFEYDEKYYWQVTGIPSTATRVAFWVVPYLTTNENTSTTYWGDAFTYDDSTSNTLPWTSSESK